MCIRDRTKDVRVVGPRGLRRSTDGGQTFSAVAAKAVGRAALTDVNAAPGGAIFVWGTTTGARSLDHGRTWTALAKPGANASARRLRIAEIAFSSSSTGLLRDSRGQIWRTTSAGRSWSVLRAVGTERIQGMATSSNRAAYLVTDTFGAGGRGGYLLRTTDAGATWQPQFVVSSPIQTDGIAAPPGGTDYLLGGDAGLLFSTTGGSAGARSTLSLSTRSRALRKASTITVTGRLSPAVGGEQVTVSELAAGATRWAHQTVQVASNGAFVSSWRVARGTTSLVAQWAGNFASGGTGSKVLTVTVGPAKRKPHKPTRRH
jgi:photosystem II stability/assembly factor-like uncharacterized protein